MTIQESAGAIVVVQRPQHCAYDQAALEQLAEQLRQSLGIIPDEIPPSTPAPGTSSVSTLRPAEPAGPPRRADDGVPDVDEGAALRAALLSPQDRTIDSMSMSFLMISVLDRSYLKRSALEIPETMTGDQFLCCPSSFDLTFLFSFVGPVEQVVPDHVRALQAKHPSGWKSVMSQQYNAASRSTGHM